MSSLSFWSTTTDAFSSGSPTVGPAFVKAAADVFAEGDEKSLKVHILIHNAAVLIDNNLEDIKIDDFNLLFNVNGES